MITTPYNALREALGKPDYWHPNWGDNLEVRRSADTTVYTAHPETLDADGVADLQQLIAAGWTIDISSRRLNRLRISIWR